MYKIIFKLLIDKFCTDGAYSTAIKAPVAEIKREKKENFTLFFHFKHTITDIFTFYLFTYLIASKLLNS